MAYRGTEQGPALEFATPYAIENRFLRWRCEVETVHVRPQRISWARLLK